MSLAEILGEHAAKATIGGLVAGFFAGAVMVRQCGANPDLAGLVKASPLAA